MPNFRSMFALQCIDRDGRSHTFHVEREDKGQDHIFRVHCSNPPDPGEDWFEATFRRESDRRLRVKTIVNNGTPKALYSAKGIPEALFQHVLDALGGPLISSSNTPVYENNEYRTDDAEKIWGRLHASNKATYSEAEDRWFHR